MTTAVTLTETDIRPDHLMAEQQRRFDADVARLLTRKGEFVQMGCPACDSRNARPAFEKYGLSYAVCADCETMYVNPRPPPPVLEDFYANSENYEYWNKFIFPASEEARRERIFRPRAERLADICRRYRSNQLELLLEVGAGFGTFCEEVTKLGLFRRVIAVEPTPSLAETCRKKGIEVIEKPIEQVRIENATVDVCASFEVLEHLFSPRDYVSHCASLLAPGGLLVITCPNVKGFDVTVLGEASNTVDAEHLNYFHPASLSALVAKTGFTVLEVTTPGKLDAELVRKKALATEFDLSGQPFLKQILIDRWDELGSPFQNFLVENQLSSHMWLVARKNG